MFKVRNYEYLVELSQINIINYIIGMEVDKGEITEMVQQENLRKIIKAIIKKMIKDERMLMVQVEANREDDRLLRVHPNYTGSKVW